MKLQVIVGSTRPGRVTPNLAKWVAREAEAKGFDDVELVDLADYDLPFLDEPISPQYNPEREPNPEAQKWLDKLAEGDAYVIVTPEYNRAPSGVLKNALDYLDFQFVKKPVALVGHGSSGGAQAIAHLRGIMSGLKAACLPTVTYFAGRVGEMLNEEGEPIEESTQGAPEAALHATLDELRWYADTLAAARAKS